MKKASKIQEMMHVMHGLSPRESGIDPCYAGYFTCFNQQQYYEAHDILEDLWLKTHDGDNAFYKGLIQFAAGFVHLQKQFRRPDHPKDRDRARPAARLFLIAARNLAPFRPLHRRLNVERVWTLSTGLAAEIAESGFVNPWTPESAPTLSLEPSSHEHTNG